MSKIIIQLIGPLSATGPKGEKLTPKGGKVGALLALLAVAKGRCCTRAWLQDKLWSDRGQQQGQDSLRHAIAELKRSLGPYASALSIDGRDLSINREAALVDLYDVLPVHAVPALPGTEFLEGIDVKDREFETWLRQMRLSLVESPVARQDETSLSDIQSGFHIALLPIESYGHSQHATLIAMEALNRIAASLSHLGPFTVFDHTGTNPPTPDPVSAPDVFMMTRCIDYGDCLSLSLSLRRAMDNKIIWSVMLTIPLLANNKTEVSAIVLQVTDQIARVLYKPGVLGPADRHQAARFALSGIDKLFSLDSSELLKADSAFARATELEDKGVYYAWRAYSIVIRASELKESNGDELRAFANELAAKALSINKNNPLTLALLTQVYAFVFRDYHRAQALIEPAIAMKSDSLMALDSLALLNFYTGNLDAARDSAVRAANASVCNPYRYGFTTTLCMIDVVAGNYESAIMHGERAFAMQSPGSANHYAPTLRYLSAAYDQVGRTDDAKRVYKLLKEQEPTLCADAIDSDEYPVPNAHARELLKQSFTRIESSLTQEIAQSEPDNEHQ